jgi:PAS domain S-box-containing protein
VREFSTSRNRLRFLNSFVRHEQAKADALFLSIGEGAMVTDAHGRISRVNPVAARLLGYKESELLGKWFPSIVVAEDSAGNVLTNLERPITRVFMTGKSVSARAYYRRKNGTRMPVSLTVSPVLLRDKPIGAIEVFRDISRELTLEQAKDDFISIASHQLRTPATGVKQYVGMILEGYVGDLTEKQRMLLTKAYESNERQIQIIDDLLKVARIDAGHIALQLAKINVIDLLQDILYEQLAKAKSKQQTLQFSHDVTSAYVNADEARLRMVFENVIDNACKYTMPNKTIRVNVIKRPRSVIVQVADEGIGIAKKDIPKIFRKFTRLDKDQPLTADGSGLGLYWAKKIIDLHGGTITVKSELNKGSVFEVRLPSVAK